MSNSNCESQEDFTEQQTARLGTEDPRRAGQESTSKGITVRTNTERATCQIHQENNKLPRCLDHEICKEEVTRAGWSKLYPGDIEAL